MKLTNINELKETKVFKLLLKYFFNTFLALVLYNLYILADALFVSWGVGANAMGGISIAFPFVIIQSGISTALGAGAASIVSRKIGEEKPNEGGLIVFNTIISFWITALITSVLGIVFLDPILNMLGVSPELYSKAKEYLFIILVGNIFSTGFSSIIRAEGNIKYSLLIWLIPITINIILDAIFVLVFKWGVKGSAIATVISQFISFCMSILYFVKFSVLDFRQVKIQFKKIKEVLTIGFPSLFQQGSLAISLIIINNVLKYINGTDSINIYAYVNKIMVFAIIPFTAVIQALAPIVGYNAGANNNERVKKVVWYSTLISLIYALVALLIIQLFPDYILLAFTKNKLILDSGVTAIRIVSLSLPFMPLNLIIGATYQAKGQKFKSLLLFISNYILFLLPATLSLAIIYGELGVWWSFPISSLGSTILSFFFILFEIQKERKLKVEN